MKIESRARADQRGFTLTELLVAIAILGLIMLGVMTLLISGNESYLTGSNQAEAQASVRAALVRMTQDIREAGYDPQGLSCTAPAPGAAGCFDPIVNPGNVALVPTPTSFMLQNDWNGAGPGPIQPGILVPVNYVLGGVQTPVNRGERTTYSVVGGNLTRQESAVDAQPQTLVTSVQLAARGQNCAGVQIANPPFFQYCGRDIGVAPNVVIDETLTSNVPTDVRSIIVNLRAGVQNQPPAIWMAGAVQVTMSDRIRLRNRTK